MTAYGNMINQVITNSIPVNNCPLNRITGSSSVGQFIDSMPSINSVVVKNYNMGINGGSSIWSGLGGCYGLAGYENAYSYNVKAMEDVSFGDTISSAFKMTAFDWTRQLTPSNALSLVSSLGNMAGGLASAGGKGLSGLGSIFSFS